MRRSMILLVTGLALLFAGPASGVVVNWQSANTTIYLGEPHASLEFENPLAGTETVKGYAVLDWRDADYAPGPPPWYDDWSVAGVFIDGDPKEIWMRNQGDKIWTTTLVASRVVSIHMVGDHNDGIAKVFVDGNHVATLDMYTAPVTPPQTALVVVTGLLKNPHHIQVDDNGVSQQAGAPADADDVATLGAAALEKKFKWNQPPDPAHPDNIYYGWNEKSVYKEDPAADDQIVADDWVCTTPDPITDIHWWGSHIGWRSGDDPSVVPSSFHITIWTDVQVGPNTDFSHPGVVLWETDCRDFTYQFVGWDYDPRTGTYEACYYYEQLLDPTEYFYQEPDMGIYWISIAAKYPDGTIIQYPWGWKTRPRDPSSPAPDDAVRIFDPTAPHVNDLYRNGEPIYWPTDADSWDMAFELTSERTEPGIKFEQQPDPSAPGLHAHDWQIPPNPVQTLTLADDWECLGGRVTDLHWYGNYELDSFGQEIRGAGIKYFHISIHRNNPQTCLPTEPPVRQWNVPFASVNETDTGLVNNEGCTIYKYEYILTYPFDQIQGEYYWFDVSAISNDPINNPHWRWQHGTPGQYCGAAQKKEPPIPGIWSRIGGGTVYINMAFEVTSDGTTEPYVKWSQPPEPYTPDDGFNGWNEFSVYGYEQIVADDWLCKTDDPVTDVHWWASFIGWAEREPPLKEMPDRFHIGIWTDGWCTDPSGMQFSCPVELIWENYCENFTWKFAGWDWDPRDPMTGPEACFLFEQDLPEAEWFWQDPTGDPQVYWLSIAAMYDTTVLPRYPFGWKTRPRYWNDDAVRIFDPTDPVHGDFYMNGEPIWWPTEEESWDMAFRLTTKEVVVPEEYLLEFSLDIGSDTELSDPYVDGDEGFDPGDVYLGGPFYAASPWYMPVTPPAQPGGRDGFKDDAIIVFPGGVAVGDPWPDPPDLNVPPMTAVPVGNGGVTQYMKYFDLDGHDELDFSLEDYYPYWEEYESPCIFGAKYLYISYDDDQKTGWPQGPPLQADVPVIVPSPLGVSSYGADPTWDELLGLTVAPGPVVPPFPYNVVAGPAGIADEKAVHPDLKPDPTLMERDDDDVDSLDIRDYDPDHEPGDPHQCACPFWFFSADHEAHMGLDPGDIYQVDRTLPPPVLPILVVDDVLHLGLPDSTDVDAFEFVWAPVPGAGFNALAVLFSVDEDDPLTLLVNESGGLDPKMIYISFMNGVNQPFLAKPLDDDVDALSNWRAEIMIPDNQPPAIETAVSVKTHGATDYAIDLLNRVNNADIECRWSGPSNPNMAGVTKLVVQFDENIQRINGNVTDVELSSSGGPGPPYRPDTVNQTAPDELTIGMSGTTNGVPLRVWFPGIADAGDITLVVWDVLCIRQLVADVRPDKSVNVGDRIDVRNQMGQPVTASNFRCDVRADGSINVGDRIDVRNAGGTGFIGTCP